MSKRSRKRSRRMAQPARSVGGGLPAVSRRVSVKVRLPDPVGVSPERSSLRYGRRLKAAVRPSVALPSKIDRVALPDVSPLSSPRRADRKPVSPAKSIPADVARAWRGVSSRLFSKAGDRKREKFSPDLLNCKQRPERKARDFPAGAGRGSGVPQKFVPWCG